MKRKVYADVCTTASIPYSSGQGVENGGIRTQDLGCKTKNVVFGKSRKLAKGSKTKTWTNDNGVTYTKTWNYHE